MDFDLLKTLSTERPSWSIVILGLVQTSAQEQVMEIMRDSSFKNIYFLGYKGYDELPLYLKHFDVSIIPYKLNRSTITMYPKKVHEILAVGKPIVSSGMPELRSLREVISIATSPREFVEMVEAELKNDSWERQKRRIEIAKEHSWEKYVVIMENLMEKTLSLKRVRK
jgi:glycosyltransferase involved in cell wall biosynthesis